MIARKSALIIGTNIVNAVLGYVGLFFITRFMSPEAYGIVSFAFSFVALFTIFGDLGFDNAHIKRVSEGGDLGQKIGTYLVTKAGLAGLMASLTIGAIFFWKIVLNGGFETSLHETAVYIMVVYHVIRLFAISLTHTFRARKEIAKSEIPLLFETIGRVAITVYVALSGLGVLALAFSYIVGDFLLVVSSVYLFRRYPIQKPSKKYFKSYASFSLPLIVVVSGSLIIRNTDKVFIQLFLSAADVGYYTAAFMIANFVAMFAQSVGILLFPSYSELHTNQDIDGIRTLTYQAERYLSLIVSPMVFGIIALSPAIAKILLSNWISTVNILRVLPAIGIIIALSQPYAMQVIGMNRPTIARNKMIIIILINIVLNFILIPKEIAGMDFPFAGLGGMGAALATISAYASGLVYNRYVALKLTKTKGNIRIILHLLSGGIMGLILYYLDSLFLINNIFYLLAAGGLGIAMYFGVLYLLNEFSKEDFWFFIRILHIRKMWKYIQQEISN